MNVNKTGLLCLAVWVNLFASSLVVTSDVSTNTTWDADTVFLNKSDFTVLNGVRLTIMSGTAVVLQKGLRIITIRGTITANGAVNDSIRFFPEDSLFTWQGIRLIKRPKGYDGIDTSYLKYCILEKAFCAFTDSVYMKSGSLVYCGPGNCVQIDNSTLSKSDGYHGGAIYVDSGATVSVKNCLFKSNTADFFGGGAIMTNDKGTKNLLVNNCTFKNNYARTGGAVRIGKGTKAEFNNCVFYHDTTLSINPDLKDLKGGAMAIFGPADVTLRSCIMFYCRSYDKGGGIYSADASIKLINCTIINNESVYGGGIYFARESGPSSPLLINTIDGGNGTTSRLPRDSAGCGIFLDSSVSPVFKNCQLYDTVYDFKFKPFTGEFSNSMYFSTEFLYNSPGFRISDTIIDGYQLYTKLSKKDPAIDGGTSDTTGLGLPEFDVLGQKRIYGSAVDIGAIEFTGSYITATNFPLIGKKGIFAGDSYKVVIYSLDGRKIGCYSSNHLPQSISEVLGKRVPKGLYLMSINHGRQSRLERVLIK